VTNEEFVELLGGGTLARNLLEVSFVAHVEELPPRRRRELRQAMREDRLAISLGARREAYWARSTAPGVLGYASVHRYIVLGPKFRDVPAGFMDPTVVHAQTRYRIDGVVRTCSLNDIAWRVASVPNHLIQSRDLVGNPLNPFKAKRVCRACAATLEIEGFAL
jgi:hypothetical protein